VFLDEGVCFIVADVDFSRWQKIEAESPTLPVAVSGDTLDGGGFVMCFFCGSHRQGHALLNKKS
jgi:hypothetical protein